MRRTIFISESQSTFWVNRRQYAGDEGPAFVIFLNHFRLPFHMEVDCVPA